MNNELMEMMRKRQQKLGIAETSVIPKKEEDLTGVKLSHTVDFSNAKKNLENLFGGGAQKESAPIPKTVRWD